MLPLLTVVAALAASSGDSVEPLLALPPACGRVQYSGGRLGWSAHRQQQGVFASPLALGPCFGAAGGGWRCAVDETLARASNGSRQVQSVDADDLVALRAFETTHRNREPLVIRSTKRSHAWLGKGKKARAKRQKFGRDALIKTAGGQEAKAGLSHDIVIFRGEGYVRFNVAEYLEEFMPAGARHDTMQGEPFYLFQRARAAGEGEAMEWVGSLASMLVPPEATGLFETPLNMRKNSAIWLIGPPRSGTAFHNHNEAWTALAHGRKRWLFYPPEVSPPGGGSGPNFYPSFAITDWLDQVLPLLPPEQRPIEAIQNAGDLMYVPEGWSHAVLNIDDTVAVSFQSSSPAAGGPYEQISKRVGHAEADGSLAERLEAAALEPCRNDVRYLVAESLRLEGRHVEAAQQYSEVLELDPLTGPAAVGLARSLLATGNHSGGVSVLKTMISRAPASRQLRGMYEKLVGDAGLEVEELYTQGDLKQVDAYRRAQFNLYDLVPQLQRVAQTAAGDGPD